MNNTIYNNLTYDIDIAEISKSGEPFEGCFTPDFYYLLTHNTSLLIFFIVCITIWILVPTISGLIILKHKNMNPKIKVLLEVLFWTILLAPIVFIISISLI